MRNSEFLSRLAGAIGRAAEDSAHGDAQPAQGFEMGFANKSQSDNRRFRSHGFS